MKSLYNVWNWVTELHEFLFNLNKIITIFLPQHDPPLPNTICMKGQDLKRDIKREIHEEKENIKTEMPETGENGEGSTHYWRIFKALDETQLTTLHTSSHLPDKLYAYMLKWLLRLRLYPKWWSEAGILGMIDNLLHFQILVYMIHALL